MDDKVIATFGGSVKRHRSRMSRDNRHSPSRPHTSRLLSPFINTQHSSPISPVSLTMFNAPRRPNGQSLSSSAFISSSTGGAGSDPLAQSTPNPSYGEVDPWSAVPSPARSGTPRRESQEVIRAGGDGVVAAVAGGREGLNAFFSEFRVS